LGKTKSKLRPFTAPIKNFPTGERGGKRGGQCIGRFEAHGKETFVDGKDYYKSRGVRIADAGGKRGWRVEPIKSKRVNRKTDPENCQFL